MLLGIIALIVIGSLVRRMFWRPPYYGGGHWNMFHGPMHHGWYDDWHHGPRDMHHGPMGPRDMGGPHGPRW